MRRLMLHTCKSAVYKEGDRIAVTLPSEASLLVIILGHYLAGVIHVPINTRYGHTEIAHVLQDCEPKAVWLDDSLSCARHLKTIAQENELTVWRDTERLMKHRIGESIQLPAVSDEDIALLFTPRGPLARARGVP